MRKIFDFNVKLLEKMKKNKILSIALIMFFTFSIINTLLIYNFVQVLQNI